MRIQHENAMVTYDFSEHHGQLYLVLEFLEGESLRAWMTQPHTTDEKIWVALQVAKALDYLHSIEILQKGEPKAPQEPWSSMPNTGHW